MKLVSIIAGCSSHNHYFKPIDDSIGILMELTLLTKQ